jgi:transposase
LITLACIEADLKRFKGDDLVRGRLFALRKILLGQSQKSVALEIGKAERTLDRWGKRYEAEGAEGLRNRPKPGRPRKKWLRGKQAGKILALRRKYGWGAEVLKAHAKKMFGIDASLYSIRQLLKRKKLTRAVRRKRKSKHTRKVKIHVPGQHTQIDVRHLDPMRDEKKRYVYNFVDHASKWTFKRVYDSYGPSETKDFMIRLLNHCPFFIARLQADNGIEFTNRFLGGAEHVLERICKSEGIRLRFIPPGEKELQGLVEGHHRIDKDEFFERIGKHSVEETNRLLAEHLLFRNGVRGFKTNGWMSPDEYLAAHAAKIFALAALWAKKSAANAEQQSGQILMAA